MRMLAPIFALLAFAPAEAQQVVSTDGSYLDARLVVGHRHADGRREAGLVLDVAPGWKTYWRAPGEAGLPPDLDWSRSTNVAAVAIAWPRPEPFESFGMTTLGYAGEVVLPIIVTPSDPAEAIDLALDAIIGVCRGVCILEEISLARSVAPDTRGPEAAIIDIARYTVPLSGEAAGVRLLACRIAGAGPVRRLSATLALPAGASEPMVVLEGPPGTRVETPRLAPEGERRYVIEADLHMGGSTWIDRSSLVTTVLAGPVAAEIAGCPATG